MSNAISTTIQVNLYPLLFCRRFECTKHHAIVFGTCDKRVSGWLAITIATITSYCNPYGHAWGLSHHIRYRSRCRFEHPDKHDEDGLRHFLASCFNYNCGGSKARSYQRQAVCDYFVFAFAQPKFLKDIWELEMQSWVTCSGCNALNPKVLLIPCRRGAPLVGIFCKDVKEAPFPQAAWATRGEKHLSEWRHVLRSSNQPERATARVAFQWQCDWRQQRFVYPSCLSCPELPRSYLELPGAAQSCQELLRAAQSCPELPRSCPEVPGAAQSCQELPRAVRSCPELPGAARSCPKLSSQEQ